MMAHSPTSFLSGLLSKWLSKAESNGELILSSILVRPARLLLFRASLFFLFFSLHTCLLHLCLCLIEILLLSRSQVLGTAIVHDFHISQTHIRCNWIVTRQNSSYLGRSLAYQNLLKLTKLALTLWPMGTVSMKSEKEIAEINQLTLHFTYYSANAPIKQLINFILVLFYTNNFIIQLKCKNVWIFWLIFEYIVKKKICQYSTQWIILCYIITTNYLINLRKYTSFKLR